MKSVSFFRNFAKVRSKCLELLVFFPSEKADHVFFLDNVTQGSCQSRSRRGGQVLVFPKYLSTFFSFFGGLAEVGSTVSADNDASPFCHSSDTNNGGTRHDGDACLEFRTPLRNVFL